MNLPWHLYAMALLYFLAGVNHFRNPKIYHKIIPPFLGNVKLINNISGIAEILLAIGLCIPHYSTMAAWGIIVLLMAIFPANLYMYTHDKAALGLSKTIRLLRLPLQLVLIAWAYCYT
ncbi:DoxX family protein [Flavobacterium sp.]|uniref:DoxX family protein n=1 Tax=Flavobacterium sp. TaxID=239 RepID=UPI002FDAEE87